MFGARICANSARAHFSCTHLKKLIKRTLEASGCTRPKNRYFSKNTLVFVDNKCTGNFVYSEFSRVKKIKISCSYAPPVPNHKKTSFFCIFLSTRVHQSPRWSALFAPFSPEFATFCTARAKLVRQKVRQITFCNNGS